MESGTSVAEIKAAHSTVGRCESTRSERLDLDFSVETPTFGFARNMDDAGRRLMAWRLPVLSDF